MNEHQRETAFLRQCLRYEDSPECHGLEERIASLQRDERCVRRALWLMLVLAGLAAAGLGYCAVFSPDYPQNTSRFITQFITKAFCALGLSSLICLLGFTWLGAVNRKELDQGREECRHLARKLLASRVGQPWLNETRPPTVQKEETPS